MILWWRIVTGGGHISDNIYRENQNTNVGLSLPKIVSLKRKSRKSAAETGKSYRVSNNMEQKYLFSCQKRQK